MPLSPSLDLDNEYFRVEHILDAKDGRKAISEFSVGCAEVLSAEQARALPWDRGAPHIDAPARFGASSWKHFSYTFPVRGSRDGMTYELQGQLPAGVAFDAKGARIEGFGAPGEYPLVFKAKNAEGRDERPFTL